MSRARSGSLRLMGTRALWFVTWSATFALALSAILAISCGLWLAAGLPDYRWPGEVQDMQHIFGNVGTLFFGGLLIAACVAPIAIAGCAATLLGPFRKQAAALGLGLRRDGVWCVAVAVAVVGLSAGYLLSV